MELSQLPSISRVSSALVGIEFALVMVVGFTLSQAEVKLLVAGIVLHTVVFADSAVVVVLQLFFIVRR